MLNLHSAMSHTHDAIDPRALRPRRAPPASFVSPPDVAGGAHAVGVFAVGPTAIGGLVSGRARIRQLEIDSLVVRKLYIVDQLGAPPSSGDTASRMTR